MAVGPWRGIAASVLGVVAVAAVVYVSTPQAKAPEMTLLQKKTQVRSSTADLIAIGENEWGILLWGILLEASKACWDGARCGAWCGALELSPAEREASRGVAQRSGGGADVMGGGSAAPRGGADAGACLHHLRRDHDRQLRHGGGEPRVLLELRVRNPPSADREEMSLGELLVGSGSGTKGPPQA